jgi:thiamine monophosphate kinase
MTKGTHGEHDDVRQAGADDGDWVHVSGTTGFDTRP